MKPQTTKEQISHKTSTLPLEVRNLSANQLHGTATCNHSSGGNGNLPNMSLFPLSTDRKISSK